MDEMKRQSLPYKHSESACGHLTKLYLSKYLFFSPEQDYVKTKTLPFLHSKFEKLFEYTKYKYEQTLLFFLKCNISFFVCIFIYYLLYI